MTETEAAETEFLCFPGPGGVYAVEFEDAVEICIDVNLRPVPRLPEYFCGVFYHKGAMIPVVQMEEQEADGGYISILVVKYRKGMFGIRIFRPPWVSAFSEDAEAGGDYRELVPKRWEVKKAYHEGSSIVFLLDIENSAGLLTAYEN